MAVAFVLSGGGARASAQVGMLRALSERSIQPDMIVGASAGAVNGAWYALHPNNLDDLERVWLGLTKRHVFPGTAAHFAYNFLRHGHAHSIQRWSSTLHRYFGTARIEDASIPLTLVTVRLRDGAVVPFRSGAVVPILSASTAIPGLFPPQRLEGELHVDGAVVEYLPIPTAVSGGATTIYALDCSDFPEGDGLVRLTIDRAGQIASAAWVRLVAELAGRRGVSIHRLRPNLGNLHDGRDFRHSKRLMKAGYEFASDFLDDLQMEMPAS